MNRISPNERICSDIDCVSDYCIKGIVNKGHRLHTCDELSSVSVTTDRFESSDRYVALWPDFPVSIVQLRNVI